jgi:hypothetical protein
VDDQAVFTYLKKQKKAVLLDYLQSAFDVMSTEQRQTVFPIAVRPPVPAEGNDEGLPH